MVTLTEGDDVFDLTLTQDETVEALGGNDTITITGFEYNYDGPIGPLYDIIVIGGTGNDEIQVDYLVDSAHLYGGDGDDNIYASGDYEGLDLYGPRVAYGGAGNDVIGSATDSTFGYGFLDAYGEEGDDLLWSGGSGGAGDDIIYEGGDGGDGSDMIIFGGGDGGAGDDFIYGGEVQRGGDGSDLLVGGYEAHGGAGNDMMLSAFGNGDEGRDVWFGLNPDTAFENDGDKIVLDQQRLVSAFTGHADEIVITAEGGVLIDEDGDGVADWSFEDYTYDADGDGIPEIVYDADFSPDDFLVEALFKMTVDETVADTASGTAAAEFFYGGGGDDVLSGAGGLDFVFGGFGNDTLSGNSGDDLLVGHAGDDRLYGGSGDDELDLGDGDDTASGSTGNDYGYGGAGDDVLAGNEGNDRLLGELGNDRLNGGTEDDELDGGDGNDMLAGEDGLDHLIGGMGNDRLAGGAGNDMLEGGAGNDTLIGGAGKDIMTGGAGADTFTFAAGDSRPGGGVRDVITDFTSGADKLDLRALGVTDQAAQVSYQMIGSGMILHVDLDHDGLDSTDFAVQLTGVSSLAAGDILF